MGGKIRILCVIFLSTIVGCTERSEPIASYGFSGGAPAVRAPALARIASEESQRFVAVRHKVVVETSEDDLPKVWGSIGQFCKTLRCEIIASSITNRTQDSPPSGNLTVRIVPEDLSKLLDQLAKGVTILQQTTESEDKTETVIDTGAKLNNLTAFRDRLRAMLASPSASIKDAIEIERELSRVQGELDSLATKRRVLANETEKVAVAISFYSKRSVVGTGVFAPIAWALQGSGSVLSASVANLITFIVAAIPWLLVVVPSIWLGAKFLRKMIRRRGAAS